MVLDNLRVSGFRNLSSGRLSFPSGISFLVGDNAQGKTNFLEALYVLSNLKSFRTSRTVDLIASGEEAAVVEGAVSSDSGSASLRVTLTAGGRAAFVDGLEPRSTGEYLGVLPSVLFSWEDIRLSLGDPEARRTYLDRAAFAAEPAHLHRLREYSRLLRQRNALLRRPSSDMDLWEERVAIAGASIRLARAKAGDELSPLAQEIHSAVGGNGETLVIRWPSAAQGGDGLADALLAELRASRSRDQRLGFTSVGPHRDPVVVELNGVEARRHASRGQHRTVAVSLRLALLVWSSRLRGDPPLFLLDDPGAELDARRMAYLGGFLEAWPGQVFIACTEGSLLPIPAQSRNLFRVADGRIQPQ